MAEAPALPVLPRVSSQRYLPALRVLAVALCAASFLTPMAHANGKKQHASSKKPAAASKAVAKTTKARAEERTVRGGRNVVATVRKSGGKTVVAVQRRSVVRVAEPAPVRQSFGQMAGLHNAIDPLDLKSSVALVLDQDTREVLLSKNDHAVLPIASITKLMTGLLISEAKLPMDEPITITQDDVDTEKFSRSRLAVGTTLPRGELL
ncbi:D-alanyl-D-alanine carboxypeptidase, partial [Pseudacidovorax intermedius]